jgi:DNA-3-methyladenine glycosylase II
VTSRRERKFLNEELAQKDSDVSLRFQPQRAAGKLCPFASHQAIAHISKVDKKMARLIDKVGPFRLELDEMLTPFEALAESIVYQQLTGKAAATIFSRVKALYGGARLPAPEIIVKTPDEKLRSAGLSGAKTLALKDLASKHGQGLIPSLGELNSMTDEEIIECLTAVRGVGRWTVEMLLIFRLGRRDVLPINDYGVRKGYAVTFGLKDKLPTPKELAAYGERWAPYRSVAAWYLWRALELPENVKKAKAAAAVKP